MSLKFQPWKVVLVISLLGGCADTSKPTKPTTAELQERTGTDSQEGLITSALEQTAKDEKSGELLQSPPDDSAAEWINLFDGETLGNWISTQFGGEAEVVVEDGKIILPMGNDMTGVTWKGEPPARMNYELELEAQRVEGNDFFCGLTFPVGKDTCSLICGGWGGGITGLSSLDDRDASENETSQWINYDKLRWYRIRVRVTESKIEAWLDDKQIVNAETEGRRIGIRPEVDPSKPLGIATWRTTGALRNMRLRKLSN